MSFLNDLLNPARRFERHYARHLLVRFRSMPFSGGAPIDLDREFVPVRGLDAALARHTRLALIGKAGAGKTTTLAHLALARARALLDDNPSAPVPIFLSARDLPPGALLRLADPSAVLRQAQDDSSRRRFPRAPNLGNALAAECPRDFFAEAIAAGRVLVLIDDLDALPSDRAAAWLSAFGNARVVATAQSTFPDFAEFRLPGFRDSDIDAYARHWDSQHADAFIAALKTSGVPRSLTANPMTLSLLVRVWRADQPLPTRRTELFDAYARTVLGGADEIAKMLEGVALAIQRGQPASNGFLSKSRGFLRTAKHRSAEFVHVLWQAYFAARALRRSPDRTFLLEFLQDPNWREVVLFYAGLGDASELVEALLWRSEACLAGHAIAHAREVRADLRDAVTQELMRRAWNGDAGAVAALSEMQSTVAVDGFAAKLKVQDPAVRLRATEILGQLQLDRGVEYLLPQLRDPDRDVRDQVIAALGHARTDRVIEPLLVALRGDPRVGVPDTRLRVAAAKALGEVGSDRAVPALVVDLQLGEPEVRAAAADALKHIKSPLLIKPLQGIAQSGDALARRYATEILAVMDGQHGRRLKRRA